MIGSISKIRPCAHHHYKYSHAKNNDDLKNVNENYSKDLTNNGEWTWNIDNLNSNTAFKNNTNLKSFVTEIPSITNAYQFFQNCSNLTNVQMETSHLTNVQGLFMGCKISEIPECFNPNTRTFDGIFDGNYWGKINEDNIYIIPYNKIIDEVTTASYAFRNSAHKWSGTNGLKIDDRYKFENLVNGTGMFYNTWPYGIGLYGNITMNLINLTNGSNMFGCGENISSFTSPLPKLTNGSNMFYRANFSLGAPFVFNSELPSLSNGENMFARCWLDKASTLRVCNSIPTYTNGSTHKLTLGIAVDYKYDPEVNLALKKVDMDFVSPIVSLGGTLSEEVTSDKGWTLTTEWNGTVSGNEYLNPVMISKLELDTIVLPEGYMRCEYLEATGTQYIDTEYIPTNTTGIWNIVKLIENVNGISVGCGYTTDNTRYYPPRLLLSGENWSYGCGIYIDAGTTGSGNKGRIYEGSLNYLISKTANIYINSNISFEKTISDLTFTPSYSLYIFGNNTLNSLNYPWVGRIYRVQITEGEEIVRDYIPCLDDSGVPCMRDIIQGNTYYNANETEPFLYKTYDNYVIQ